MRSSDQESMADARLSRLERDRAAAAGGARGRCAAALDVTGNPSSVHAEGRAARRLVEQAREQVAALVGADRARRGVHLGRHRGQHAGADARASRRRRAPRDRLLVSAIEHPSVLRGGRFAGRSRSMPVDGRRRGRSRGAGAAARRGRRAAAGLAHARQQRDRRRSSRSPRPPTLVHAAGGLLHVDAVQAAGPDPCRYQGARRRSADAVGAQDRRPEGRRRADPARRTCRSTPLIKGGGQERGARAGTENVAGIAGFGAAAAAAGRRLADGGRPHGGAARPARGRAQGRRARGRDLRRARPTRLPNTTLFAVPGMKAETAVIAFDLEGVAVSSGAACSSGKVAPSHVLAAMGVPPELARGAIRVSLGYATTESDDRDVSKSLGQARGKPI